MKVTYEEFFKDPEKYITIAETEEVQLVKDGYVYVYLFNPDGEKIKAARNLMNLMEGCKYDASDR